MGIICLPASFLMHDDAEDGFEAFFDHLEHAIDILGIDRVGIGSDFGSWNFAGRPDTPDEIKTGIEDAFRTVGIKSRDSYIEVDEWGLGLIQKYTDWHHIPRELRSRGYSDTEVDKIMALA